MVGAPGAAGPLGNMAEAPPRVGRRAHRRGSAKGMWRAQRSVKPPRKLWGFDSLPAHQPQFVFGSLGFLYERGLPVVGRTIFDSSSDSNLEAAVFRAACGVENRWTVVGAPARSIGP